MSTYTYIKTYIEYISTKHIQIFVCNFFLVLKKDDYYSVAPCSPKKILMVTFHYITYIKDVDFFIQFFFKFKLLFHGQHDLTARFTKKKFKFRQKLKLVF